MTIVGYTSAMADLTYISAGNSKTECFSFDLPAKITCPGMTAACGEKCYAYNLMRAYTNVDAKYQRNLEFANTDAFVPHMIRCIPRRCEFRMHVSGDMYSAAYIAKWIDICSERPDVIFYTYTRSWRNPELWELIQALATLPNVNVNLSVDDETGKPEVDNAESFRWCYLTHDDNTPEWIRSGDIVFRSAHGGQKKRRKNDEKKGIDPDIRSPLVHKLGAGTVCPMERGKDMPKHFSCATCHLCVDKPKGVAVNA